MAFARKGRVIFAAYMFLLPNLLGFLVFTSLPVVAALGLSFFEWDLFKPPKFVGLNNVTRLLGFHAVQPQPPGGTGAIVPSSLLLAVLLFTAPVAAVWAFRRDYKGWGWALVSLCVGSVAGLLMVGNAALQIIWPNDPEFWYYCFNTVFLMLAIPVNMLGSLFLAMIMNQKLRGIAVFRTFYFMPSIVAGVATYLLWRWIYNPDYGIINVMITSWIPKSISHGIATVCAFIGNVFYGQPLEWPPKWLASIGWAKPALMFMGFWAGVGGYNMILYLAALQGVSPELYEAADIDGANMWSKFRHITWPMVSPTTFFIFTMSLIGGFQGGFEQALVMTGGGPAGATTTISYYIYNHAFQWSHMGYAAAIAWVLFASVFTATMLNWRFGGRIVHY